MMTKKLLITGVVLTIIGAIAAFVGFSLGASTNLVWHNGVKIARQSSQTYHIKHLSQVKHFNFDTSGYNVEFKTGTTASVKVTGSNLVNPKVTQKNGTVTIDSKTLDAPGMWLSGTQDALIIITLPANTKLDSLSGTIDDGNLDTQAGFTLQTLDLQLANGNADIHGMTVTNSGRLSLNNGHLNLYGVTFNNATVSQQNGKLDVESSTLTGGNYSAKNGNQEFDNTTFNQSVNIHNQNGKVELESPTTQGYQLTTQNGHIELFDHDATNQLNQNESATNKVIISTQNGSIEID